MRFADEIRMMRNEIAGSLLFLCCAVGAGLLVGGQSSAAQASSAASKQDAKQLCRISGMVVKLAGSEPIRGAYVQLENADERERVIKVLSDSGGRFEIKGIAPGRYNLRVARNGFVPEEYGQRKPEDPGSILTLRAGQEIEDLLFRLIPSAVISGRVLNEDGEPQPWARVFAMRQKYDGGKRELATEAQFETNDLGEYRLFGLRPGRYFIKAVPQQSEVYGERQPNSAEAARGQQGYGTTYYPNASDSSKASTVTVKAGEEISSADLFLREVRVFHVRGRMFNEITHRQGARSTAILLPRGKNLEWDGSARSSVVNGDGAFDIGDVPPGAYVLLGYWFDEGKGHTGRMPVEVVNADVDGVALTITSGVAIGGRIVWEGPPSMTEDELSIDLKSTEDMFAFSGSTRVPQSGLFTIKDVSEGEYEVRVSGQSPDCYMKDVRYGDSPALEHGFTVARSSLLPLEITLSSQGARVRGAVVNGDHLPAAGVWVVLAPEPPNRSEQRLYMTRTTDQYGHFDLRGVTPGEYQLFSWEQVEQGAWEDPEFLKTFEGKGERLSLKELDQKTVNLTAIASAAPPQSAKP